MSRIWRRLTYWSWKNAVLDGNPERKRRALERAIAQRNPRMASVILDSLLLIRKDIPDIEEQVAHLLHLIGERDSRHLVRLLLQTVSVYEGDYGARTRALLLGQSLIPYPERELELAALLQTAREPIVRLAAVQALRGQKAPLAPALLLGVADDVEEVQLECLNALAEIELRPDDILVLRETLDMMLSEPRYTLRNAAAQTLQKGGWIPTEEPQRGLYWLSLGDWEQVRENRSIRALEKALVFDDETALQSASLLSEIGDATSVGAIITAMKERVTLAQTLERVLAAIMERDLKAITCDDLRSVMELHDVQTGEEVDLGLLHTWALDLKILHDLARAELKRRGDICD